MKILKIWIFSFAGQQLFLKDYGSIKSVAAPDPAQDAMVANMLNTGVVHSFLNFFNSILVKKYCDIMLFDDILFTFDYMFDGSLKFITLLLTRIDKTIELEAQADILKNLAKRISYNFAETYRDVVDIMQVNLNIFKPFEEDCDRILHDIADELQTKLKQQKMRINGF